MSEIDGFISLLDVAIEACKRTICEGKECDKQWYVSNGARSLAWLEELRVNALSGGISSNAGSTLGLSRDLSEWAPDYLYEAGLNIDKWYHER